MPDKHPPLDNQQSIEKALAVYELAREFCREDTASVAAILVTRLLTHYLDCGGHCAEDVTNYTREMLALTEFLHNLEELAA